MLSVFENVLAAENQKNISRFLLKKMFDINALKLGATGKINEKFSKKNIKL